MGCTSCGSSNSACSGSCGGDCGQPTVIVSKLGQQGPVGPVGPTLAPYLHYNEINTSQNTGAYDYFGNPIAFPHTGTGVWTMPAGTLSKQGDWVQMEVHMKSTLASASRFFQFRINQEFPVPIPGLVFLESEFEVNTFFMTATFRMYRQTNVRVWIEYKIDHYDVNFVKVKEEWVPLREVDLSTLSIPVNLDTTFAEIAAFGYTAGVGSSITNHTKTLVTTYILP